MTAMTMPPEIITSPANPLVKTLRSLERKKGRTETGLFLAEGARLVEQGLQQGWDVEILMAAPAAMERPHMAGLLKLAAQKGSRIIEAPERILSKVTRKDNPQAVIAAFQQRSLQLSDIEQDGAGLWLGLYEVRDPGNLGTILRTADCAGVRGVAQIETCCDPYSVEAVRASMGSVFDMPFVNASFHEFDAWRRAGGMRMTAASVNGTARHDADIYGDRAVILMGNEQSGLPETAEAACDTLSLIPMRGGADSLNLAQATAIMTYEAWRQRGFEGGFEGART